MNLRKYLNLKKIKGCKIFAVSTLTYILAISTPSQAAVSLDRTRVIFEGNVKSVSLNISNQNKSLPYLAQGWIEDESGKKITTPLMVLPPVQRVEPGKSSQIKIQTASNFNALAQDKETLFYFNLREIPPKSNKPNTLQLALQTRIKLFYRPTSIAIDTNSTPPQENVFLSKQQGFFTINNPTPYYITIVDAKKNKNVEGIKNFEPVMVAPKSTSPLKIKAAELGPNPVLTYVNDYGGRPDLIFSCNDEMCRVEAKKN